MTSTNNKLKADINQRRPSIGGPGTQLPAFVESFLSWSLAISCLSVSGYHYVVATFVTPMWTKFQNSTKRALLQNTTSSSSGSSSNKEHAPGDLVFFPCWLPLMTCSRGELARATPMERYQQLVRVLEAMGMTANQWYNHDLLIQHVRSNEICRRLASLAMRPHSTTTAASTSTRTTTSISTLQNSPHTLELGQQLIRIWPRLLELPQDKGETYSFDISVIMPAYGERGVDVQTKLSYALQGASNPERIQIVLVDAGKCQDLSVVANTPMTSSSTTTNSSAMTKRWGELQVVVFKHGGGRGPALNFGAQHAKGRFLTFCHSDTRLPVAWDRKVIQSLTTTRHENKSVVANSCAFAFGIDTTPAGLNGGPFPPGIKAVETTANIRTHLYSLPYGDQCLSIPTHIFRYLGGFPDQCLMEDYELIGLLRKRAALCPKFWVAPYNTNGITMRREKLSIIGGPPALCSPRRWQKFGVLYVTFTNSKVVNLYAGGGNIDDIFQLYYGSPPPTRSSEASPWEVEMEPLLVSSSNKKDTTS